MAMQTHPLATQRIGDIVRFNAAASRVFADLGIGPRYLFWTVEHAARAQGVELEKVIRELVNTFAKQRRVASDSVSL